MTHDSTLDGLLISLFEAWNRGDAPDFGKLFTEDATYVTGDGRLVRGNDAIALLAAASGMVSSVQLGDILCCRAHGGIAEVLFEWYSPKAGRRGVATVVAIARNRDWRIEHVHNTNCA
jgi:hypothetical protein